MTTDVTGLIACDCACQSPASVVLPAALALGHGGGGEAAEHGTRDVQAAAGAELAPGAAGQEGEAGGGERDAAGRSGLVLAHASSVWLPGPVPQAPYGNECASARPSLAAGFPWQSGVDAATPGGLLGEADRLESGDDQVEAELEALVIVRSGHVRGYRREHRVAPGGD
jgi:hypothetical protein